MIVRPIYLDVFWDYVFGRSYAENTYDGYTGTQLANGYGTLVSASALNAASLVLGSGEAAAAQFTAGMPVTVGTVGSYDWQQFMVTSVAGDTLNVYPRTRVAISTGAQVWGSWSNNAHVASYAGSISGFISWLLGAKRAGRYGGGNMLGRFTERYSDANSETNTPMGWRTGRTSAADSSGTWLVPANASEITMQATTYSTGVGGSNTSDGYGFSLVTNTTANQGIEYLQSINVTPGKKICLSWKARVSANTANFVIVDADNPGTVVATTGEIGLPVNSQYFVLGMTEQLVFTVPASVYRVKLRYTVKAIAGTSFVDWVRMYEVDDDEIGQYVFDAPMEKLTVLGDSWGIQVDDYLGPALAGRNVTVTNSSTSGWRVDQLNAEFATRVPTNSDACLLLASTNDVAQGATVAQLLSRIATFCDLCEAGGIQPIIMGVPPLGGATYSLATSNTLNNAIRNYVWNRAAFSVQAGLTAADVIEAFKADTELGTTGMVADAATAASGATLSPESIAALVAAGGVTSFSPVSITGQITEPIVIGDDYIAALDTAFTWNVPVLPGVDVGDAECSFGIKNAAGAGFIVEGTVTEVDVDTWKLSFDVPRSEFAGLTKGTYEWSAEVRDVAGNEVTRVRNADFNYRAQLVEKQT